MSGELLPEIAIGAKAVAAIALAASGKRLRPAAVLVTAGIGADAIRQAVASAVLHPARASGMDPYVGATRLAFHVEQALHVGWPIGIAGLCWHAWAGQWRFAPRAWALLVFVLAAGYPELRGNALGSAYGCVTFASLCVAFAAVAASPSKARIGAAQLVALLLAAGEGATLLGPHVANPFTDWGLAQLTWIPAYAVVAIVALFTLAATRSAWTSRAP